MIHLSAFDLEKSLIRAFRKKSSLTDLVSVMNAGQPLSDRPIVRLWVEVLKTQVVGIGRVRASGEITISIPSVEEKVSEEKVLAPLRVVLTETLELIQGTRPIGVAFLTEKDCRREVKSDAHLTIIEFKALLKLDQIFEDIDDEGEE